MRARRILIIGSFIAFSVIGCAQTTVPGGWRRVSHAESFILRVDATSDETTI
jgi:hypothetical protein